MKTNWVHRAAICVAMLSLSACGHDRSASSMNRIHVETPFSIAKAGHRATLEFEATAEQATPGKVYMVSLTFDQTKAADPLDAISGIPPRTLLPFKVKVIHLRGDGKQVPVALMDGAEFLGKIDPARYPNDIPEDPDAGIYFAFTYGHTYAPSTGPQGFICLARFVLKEPGRYRAEVETVQDQPIFMGVPSVLIVQKRFNLGE